MILTVKITYLDGTVDFKECRDLSEIPLDNVSTIRVIREEDEINHANVNCERLGICTKNPNRSVDK